MGPGGAVPINATTPQADPTSAPRSPTAELKVISRQYSIGKPRVGAFPNDTGAFYVTSDCSGGVPAARIKRRIQMRERGIHLSFPEHIASRKGRGLSLAARLETARRGVEDTATRTSIQPRFVTMPLQRNSGYFLDRFPFAAFLAGLFLIGFFARLIAFFRARAIALGLAWRGW